MLGPLLIVLATCAAVEIALRTPLKTSLDRLVFHSRRSAQIIAARGVSDHWKEKALPKHALRLFFASMLLMLVIVAVFSPFLVAEAVSRLLEESLIDVLISYWGVALSVLTGGLYYFVRRRFAHA